MDQSITDPTFSGLSILSPGDLSLDEVSFAAGTLLSHSYLDSFTSSISEGCDLDRGANFPSRLNQKGLPYSSEFSSLIPLNYPVLIGSNETSGVLDFNPGLVYPHHMHEVKGWANPLDGPKSETPWDCKASKRSTGFSLQPRLFYKVIRTGGLVEQPNVRNLWPFRRQRW